MNRKILFIVISIAIILFVFLIGNVLYNVALQSYNQQAQGTPVFEGMNITRAITMKQANQTINYEILVRGNEEVQFAMWSKALSGSVQLTITDEEGKQVYAQQGRQLNVRERLALQRGHYFVQAVFSNYSGTTRLGFSGVRMLANLPQENYRTIQANPAAGFNWDYLLYLPDSITSPYLLVIPNNSGFEEDDIVFHLAEAQQLIKESSSMADDLGTALLVPVFPRPDGDLSEYYTHNLDRSALLMDTDGYRRLDLQLLAMVDDARARLNEDAIETNERIVLWGFSASGTFSDRFSLLHPERVKAVAAGGCTHSLPLAEYDGENLPYPIGIYDYEAITAHPFDEEAFASIPRLFYKGDQDPGGKVEIDGITYPANDYFDLFIRADLEARVEILPAPIVQNASMTYAEEEAIKYRIYHGAVFVDEFKAVQEIYAQAGMWNTEFKLYPGVGHEISDEMETELLMFLKDAIE